MTQRKSTKRALLASALALLMCISMLIGSTFAWFTDEVTSAGNKIQSGTLKVDLELLDKETGVWHSIKQTKAPIFNYDLWEPGYVDTKILKVENEGNLALKWVAQFYSENELSILADVIDVYVCPSKTELQYPDSRDLEGYTCVGNLREFINTIEETTYGNLEAGEAAYLGIALKMQESAGNEYQDLSLGGAFDIRIFATQYTSESDSFNNTYDTLADESILASQSKTLANGADSIEFVLSDKGTVIAKISVPASAIADTSKPVTATVDGIDPTLTITVGENTKAYAYDIDVTNLKENLSGDQLVTVTVSAPNALPSMNAYHNGVLIEDALYDEVEGTITFKTASFSPYAITYTVQDVHTWEELRTAVAQDNVEIKLMQDITVNLAANGSDRSENHRFTGSETTYYNGVNISGQNVSIDLNGHTITASCGKDSLNTTGALFFVEMKGSLNINDRRGGGTIKMANCFYMVWAPFAAPSYVDIYSGIFLADKYADDPMAPGNTDYSENDNRALVYAGEGGNMNIYGGYFLYENTPNDNTNRNNGAFNALDLAKKVCITIHPNAKLINAQYKQDPTYTTAGQQWGCYYDAYSIKLKNGYTMKQVNENVTIDGTTYNTWYTPVESGPDGWNIGYICVGKEDPQPNSSNQTGYDPGPTYFSFAETNGTYTGKNGEVASGFVPSNTNDIVATKLDGHGNLKITSVTNETQLGLLAGWISFAEYENIRLGYYVDGDLSTFVEGETFNMKNLSAFFGVTNLFTYNVRPDVSEFAAGSNHTITFVAQAVKIVNEGKDNEQKVAYETVDLCVWDITMAN